MAKVLSLLRGLFTGTASGLSALKTVSRLFMTVWRSYNKAQEKEEKRAIQRRFDQFKQALDDADDGKQVADAINRRYDGNSSGLQSP